MLIIITKMPTITKIITKVIVGIILFIISLKRCKSNIRNLSEVMHVGGGGHGKKTWSRKGATGNFLASVGGQDEIISERTQNHQPPPPSS
jgi:hypothetical protein